MNFCCEQQLMFDYALISTCFFCLSLGIDKEIKLENMQMKNGIYYFSKGGTTKLPKKC